MNLQNHDYENVQFQSNSPRTMTRTCIFHSVEERNQYVKNEQQRVIKGQSPIYYLKYAPEEYY